jgi:hypothetical protein
VGTLNMVPGNPLMTTVLSKLAVHIIGSDKISLGCQTVLHISRHT